MGALPPLAFFVLVAVGGLGVGRGLAPSLHWHNFLSSSPCALGCVASVSIKVSRWFGIRPKLYEQ